MQFKVIFPWYHRGMFRRRETAAVVPRVMWETFGVPPPPQPPQPPHPHEESAH